MNQNNPNNQNKQTKTSQMTEIHQNCIFCKIIAKTIPAKIIYEDEHILAFHDIAPKADVHFLVIPKMHIVSMLDLQVQNHTHQQLMGHMLTSIPHIAASQGLSAFKLVVHNGEQAGQEVMHLHIHVMGALP